MQTIRTSGPAMTPPIPPVSNLHDINGVLITLDCEVIVNRWRVGGASLIKNPWFRAKVVGIGDSGLPGREILKIRPHGSTYVEATKPEACEVHVFDEYAWLAAETAVAFAMGSDKADAWGVVRRENRGVDLAKCLHGGFYFEPFQHAAGSAYVEALGAPDSYRLDHARLYDRKPA